jgi:hypothetical protein
MRAKLFLIFIILLFASPVWATTYYVNSNCTDNNVDSATPDETDYTPSTGTCSGGSDNVYATIQDITNIDYADGDIVSFARAQTYDDADYAEWDEGNTTGSDESVTFNAHGSGALPKFDGDTIRMGRIGNDSGTLGTVYVKDLYLEGSAAFNGEVFTIEDVPNVYIDNFDFDGDVGGTVYAWGNAVLRIDWDTINPGYVEIKNCDMTDYVFQSGKADEERSATPESDSTMVLITYNMALGNPTGLDIHDNDFSNAQSDLIQISGATGFQSWGAGIKILDNDFADAGENNIDCKECKYLQISGNTFSNIDWGITDTSNFMQSLIILHHANSGPAKIYDNKFNGNYCSDYSRTAGEGSKDGTCDPADGGTLEAFGAGISIEEITDVEINLNEFINTSAMVVINGGTNNARVHNNSWRNHLVVDWAWSDLCDGANNFNCSALAVQGQNLVAPILLYNNSFYTTSANLRAGIFLKGTGDYVVDAVVTTKNNLIRLGSSSASYPLYIATGATDPTVDQDTYHNANHVNRVYDEGTTWDSTEFGGVDSGDWNDPAGSHPNDESRDMLYPGATFPDPQTGDQDLQGAAWERGAYVYIEDAPPEPPPPSDLKIQLYGDLYLYGQWMPTTFSRTLRVGQDYADLDAFEAAMLQGPVGGMVSGDWIKVVYDDPDTIIFANFRHYLPLGVITVEGRKHLLGTVTLGDNYDLYGGNNLAGLGLGASNRVYPYGKLFFSGTESFEDFQTKEDPDIWWENYRVSDGSGGWEDYRITE